MAIIKTGFLSLNESNQIVSVVVNIEKNFFGKQKVKSLEVAPVAKPYEAVTFLFRGARNDAGNSFWMFGSNDRRHLSPILTVSESGITEFSLFNAETGQVVCSNGVEFN